MYYQRGQVAKRGVDQDQYYSEASAPSASEAEMRPKRASFRGRALDWVQKMI